MTATARQLALVPLLFGIWFFGVLAPYGLHVGEDGDVLYQVYTTYRGGLPYIDFSTGYTPGYFYWHALLFRLFGPDVLWMRLSVATANVVTLWLLFHVAARLVPPIRALVAPLVFVGGLPVFAGEFCSFNVPYPAWYNITLWLGSLAALLAYLDGGRRRWLFAAALLAGVSFSVKPNVGLFNLAALSFVVLWWHAPGPADSSPARWCWHALALATMAGVLAVFPRLQSREFLLFPLPLLVLAGILLLNGRRAPGKPGLLPAVGLLLLGFALPTIPWLAYFLVLLGPSGFARDVLLIGSSYEEFFHIAHRPIGSPWDLGVLAVGLGVFLGPWLLRRRLVSLWLLPTVAAAALGALLGYVLFLAPMQHGFQVALQTRMQDVAFFVVQAVNWCGIALVARATLGDPWARRPALGRLVTVAVSAPAMLLGMYPRSDYMHLLVSAPCAIVLATAIASRAVDRWRAVLEGGWAWRMATAAAIFGPVALIAALMAAPGAALAARLSAHYANLKPDEFVPFGMPHASLVTARANEPRIDALRRAAVFIRAHTTPDEYVFPFPNLQLLNFLAERFNPAPKGYFIAGYPDHATEAEIVEHLRQHPPRLIVSLNEHQIFVMTAPLYYFLIRDFVREGYQPAAEFGPYLALRRRGMQAPASPPAPTLASRTDVVADATAATDASWTELEDPDPSVQRRSAERIGTMRDPRGAAALARRAVSKDSPYRILFLRIASGFADERAVPPLMEIARRELMHEAGQVAASALFFIAEKSIAETYWFTAEAQQQRLAALPERLDTDLIRLWLRTVDGDGRLRYFAAWAAGVARDREAIPYLLMMLGGGNLTLATAAAHALTALGQVEGTAAGVVNLLYYDETYFPSILIDLYRLDPDRVRPVIAQGLQNGPRRQRETLSWVAAALRDDRTLLPLVDALRDDDDRRVRRAAAFAVRH